MHKRFFLIIFILARTIDCDSQNIAFNHLTMENGLPSNTVLSIIKDARGFMWFGSATGLARYDGIRFREYKSDKKDSSSISNDYILSLFSDSKKNLWVGTYGGLDLYNPATDNFERVKLKNDRGGSIYCIHEDGIGRLWIGTSNGLYLLSGKDKNILQSFFASDLPNSIAGNIVKAIVSDRNGNTWAGTDKGLSKINELNGEYKIKNFRKTATKAGSLNADYITALAVDKNENLWIGTQHDGVNLYLNSSNDDFISISHSNQDASSLINNNIREIITTNKGDLWIGTQEGISIINPDTRVIKSFQHETANKKSLSQNSVYSLFEDPSGSVWAGTYFGGVNITYSLETPFSTIQNNSSQSGLSNNVISSIVEDENQNLWIGTEGGGLNYWDRGRNIFTVYKNKLNDPASLGSNLVKAVYLDRDGNPWIGTHGGGLNVFDRKTKKFIRYLFKENDPASLLLESSSLTEDNLGRLWVATNSGLLLFQRDGLLIEPVGLKGGPNRLIKSRENVVYKDRQNQIWIGGGEGLYKVKNDEIIPVDTIASVNCIIQDSLGNLWVGTGLGEIAKLEPGNSKLSFFEIPDNPNILGILDDNQGNLWLSTSKGLLKFNITEKKAQTYTASDGLAGDHFNTNASLKDKQGEFFFGGYNGITNFFPAEIEINPNKAPIVFTVLKLFNNYVQINDESNLLKQDISQTAKIVFTHSQNVFTIEFALLNFIKSNKNIYAYKLEGFDKDWNVVSVPSATYTNLPAGKYTLLVKGANNDAVWSEPAEIKIIIKPPFWLTWWAYCIYIIAGAALLFLIARYFFLKALFRKENELHHVKLNFFTNVSHEIRTHLTLIMAPVEKLLDTNEKDNFFHQQLLQVKGNANRLLKLVSELMDFRKAETHNLALKLNKENLIPFLQDIYNNFREVSLAKDISMSFFHNKEDIQLYFDREQMEKVFFNLLTNAFKFTPAGGRIILIAEEKDNKVTITVTDNGRGIAPQYLDKLFSNFFQVLDHGLQNTGYGIGLALSKHIVELHRGSINVESDPSTAEKEGKTMFTVTLQQGNLHFESSQITGPSAVTDAIANEKPPVPIIHKPLIPDNEKPLKELTILIAEDNSELRLLIQETFDNDYNVLLCENGLTGWNSAVEQIPDIIISDVMMPEMDGFTLCEKLKTDERTSHIPVILLTAKSSQSDHVTGLETGADIYITKPFSTKILELSVRNLLTAREKIRQKFSKQIVEAPLPETIDAVLTEDSFVNTIDKEFLQKVIALVDEHMDNPEFGVEMLSRKVAMSAPILYKKIKAVSGMSVNEFAKSLRMKKAAELLLQKKMTVYEVAFAVGYNDRKYFSQEFKKHFGKTPSEYNGGE